MRPGPRRRSREEWVRAFAGAAHGHVLWDGWAKDPTNPEHAYTSAWQFVDHARHHGFFRPGSRILDLGCGNGRFGICFSEMPVEYEGIDPMAECIAFCEAAFAPFPHLRFRHTPVHSPDYGLAGGVRPEDFRLAYPDRHFDDVICYSVFTHLQTLPAAARYTDEVRRVLKPGGRLFATWYRSPPDPRPDPYAGRTVYREADIMTLMHGFRVLDTYGGHSGQYYDQWAMFCQRL